MAGHAVLPEEVPQDIMEKPPSPPKLGKLVITPGGQLCVLDAMIKAWYHHPEYGARFRAWMDTFSEESSRASLSSLSGVIVIVM